MREFDIEKDLREIVGERVTTSPFEGWFYRSDLLPLPGWIKLLFQTKPAAVVKPKTTSEIAAILRYCFSHRIPVVPRGAGSSALFGAVPKKGGIVLDLTDLSLVDEVDANKMLVTCQAGISWWELDKRLRKEGLTVKSYPSSARSATVGGWIMGSGLGIGTLKYGPVFEQLVSAEIVLADGTVKEYTQGQGLEWFFASEGILGILTKATLGVRRLPEATCHHLLYFDNISDLSSFVNHLVSTAPLPYAVEFFDYKYLSLLEAAGHKITDFGNGGGVVLVTYDGKREEVDESTGIIEKLAPLHHGAARKGADEEWQQRFNMLRVKRGVPTVILSSVRIPLASLSQFHLRLSKLGKRPVGLLGHVINGSECMLLPMSVSDERKLVEYTLSLHTPRDISNLALTVGGKPEGGVGVWNAPYRDKILSKQKAEEIKRRKEQLDPEGILNPGMWLGPPLLFRPGLYQLAMSVARGLDGVLPARLGKMAEAGFKKEVAACVQCGYCMNYCPTRQEWVSSTPRGRILMTKNLFLPHSENSINSDYVNSVFRCTLCGRCKVDCSVNIESPTLWIDLRSHLVKEGFELESLRTLVKTIETTHNLVSKPNDQRTSWLRRLKLPYELERKEGAKVVYYVGCSTSFYPMVQDIARCFVQILNLASIDFTILGGDEWCCGFPLLAAGHKEKAANSMKHNIDIIKHLGANCVVVTCPGCYRMWKDEYYHITGQKPPFDVFHATEFIVRLLEKGSIKLAGLNESVTYHDPCDLGRNSKIFDEPRYIINKIHGLGFVELEDCREYGTCCGAGGDLLASNQGLSLDIAKHKVKQISATGASTVVTSCPTCIRAINMAKLEEKANFNVQDIVQLVWKAVAK